MPSVVPGRTYGVAEVEVDVLGVLVSAKTPLTKEASLVERMVLMGPLSSDTAFRVMSGMSNCWN